MTDKSPDTREAGVRALASGGHVFYLKPIGAPALRVGTFCTLGMPVEQDVDGISAGLRSGGIGGVRPHLDQHECRLRHAAAHLSQTIGRRILGTSSRVGKEGFLECLKAVLL